jgi:hypothetical protein
LFISIRNAASCCQPRQEISLPRGARTMRGAAGGREAVDVTPAIVTAGDGAASHAAS